MTPIVDGKHLTFEAGGLYDGLVVLRDLETKSYWNHITGECIMGKYEGRTLETDNLFHYMLDMAIETHPNLQIAISQIPFPFSIFAKVSDKLLRGNKGLIPPHFRKSMAAKDGRLNEHDIGLGVVVNKQAKFYEVNTIITAGEIHDNLGGEDLIIQFDDISRTPRCFYKNSKNMPLQLYTRWYGFSYTYKGCLIYDHK
ncbi:DUF3179 domain-containing protein [Acidaminobacter sp. JC074]|nr:DUF3179 domain-containing protein [Acidaminobacter sp. JC074]